MSNGRREYISKFVEDLPEVDRSQRAAAPSPTSPTRSGSVSDKTTESSNEIVSEYDNTTTHWHADCSPPCAHDPLNINDAFAALYLPTTTNPERFRLVFTVLAVDTIFSTQSYTGLQQFWPQGSYRYSSDLYGDLWTFAVVFYQRYGEILWRWTEQQAVIERLYGFFQALAQCNILRGTATSDELLDELRILGGQRLRSQATEASGFIVD